ncbi:MAG TPA: hypothetical protein VMW36_00125 [Patescibacteria group bacterium]|nr:hypothetical protein [Patescibacteria group bacterium]
MIARVVVSLSRGDVSDEENTDFSVRRMNSVLYWDSMKNPIPLFILFKETLEI